MCVVRSTVRLRAIPPRSVRPPRRRGGASAGAGARGRASLQRCVLWMDYSCVLTQDACAARQWGGELYHSRTGQGSGGKGGCHAGNPSAAIRREAWPHPCRWPLAAPHAVRVHLRPWGVQRLTPGRGEKQCSPAEKRRFPARHGQNASTQARDTPSQPAAPLPTPPPPSTPPLALRAPARQRS
jgi:hypothetical protein